MRRLPFLFSLFCCLAVSALVSCSNKPEKLVEPKPDSHRGAEASAAGPAGLAQEVGQQLTGVRYTHSEEGRLQWELVAGTVRQPLDGPTELEDVKITYYSEEGRLITLTARTGMYERQSNNAVFRGDVAVKTSDDGLLNADILKWNQETETLSGEGEVTMSRGDSALKGKGFELMPDTGTFKIHEVSGVIYQGDVNL